MFLCKNTPDYFCSELTMNKCTEHWSFDQNLQAPKYQLSSDADVFENDYNNVHHMEWSPGHTNIQESVVVDQNHYYGDNLVQSSSFPHYHTVQYTTLPPEPVPYPVYQLPKPFQNNSNTQKRHRALITFVPTKSRNFKAIVKRKRKRTVFTTEQVEALEQIFKRKQYITREDREIIVNQLQLNDKAVKIWFQNRRLKDKKSPEQMKEEFNEIPSLEGTNFPDVARLDYVESKINEKTDEFGYVTLDDSVMKDLFIVIDDFLTNNRSNILLEDTIESDSSPVYEPISPYASASDSNDEENACWKASEPNESLQRLFDLQTMLSL